MRLREFLCYSQIPEPDRPLRKRLRCYFRRGPRRGSHHIHRHWCRLPILHGCRPSQMRWLPQTHHRQRSLHCSFPMKGAPKTDRPFPHPRHSRHSVALPQEDHQFRRCQNHRHLQLICRKYRPYRLPLLPWSHRKDFGFRLKDLKKGRLLQDCCWMCHGMRGHQQ